MEGMSGKAKRRLSASLVRALVVSRKWKIWALRRHNRITQRQIDICNLNKKCGNFACTAQKAWIKRISESLANCTCFSKIWLRRHFNYFSTMSCIRRLHSRLSSCESCAEYTQNDDKQGPKLYQCLCEGKTKNNATLTTLIKSKVNSAAKPQSVSDRRRAVSLWTRLATIPRMASATVK